MDTTKLIALINYYNSNCSFSIDEEFVEKFFEEISPDNIFGILFALYIFSSREKNPDYFVNTFIQLSLRLGKITKLTVRKLYEEELTISEKRNLLFDLKTLFNLNVLDKEEVETLCNESMQNDKHKVSHSDMYFLFHKGWYYRSDVCGLSKDFIKYCFEKSKYLSLIDQSLIAMTLEKTYSGSITPEEIRNRLLDGISEDPHSHGIHRFVWLHYKVTNCDVSEEDKLIHLLVEKMALYAGDLYLMTSIIEQFEHAAIGINSSQKLKKLLHGKLIRTTSEIFNYAEDLLLQK